MSLQSNKKSVIESTSMAMYTVQDDYTTKVRENISTQNLILIPIVKGAIGLYIY